MVIVKTVALLLLLQVRRETEPTRLSMLLRATENHTPTQLRATDMQFNVKLDVLPHRPTVYVAVRDEQQSSGPTAQ